MTLSLDWTAKLWRLCGTTRFDVIHASSPGMLLVPAIVTSRLQGIPLLMSYHTHLPVYVRTYFSAPWNRIVEWFSWQTLWLFHYFADMTLVTSPEIAQELQQHGIRNIGLWPKGVNTTQFHPSMATAKMKAAMSANNIDTDFLLVYIGRISREKSLKSLKTILEGLLVRGIAARLCLVGDGPEFSNLQEHFKNTPTTFLGSQHGLELSQAFASGDVFVMPSDSETLGFVVMESMASGVPVVASRAGGLVDLVQDGDTGFLVSPHDTEAFVERIVELYNNATLRNDMRLRGRQVAELWSWEVSMDFVRQTAYPQAIANFNKRWEQRLLQWLRLSPHRPKDATPSDILPNTFT